MNRVRQSHVGQMTYPSIERTKNCAYHVAKKRATAAVAVHVHYIEYNKNGMVHCNVLSFLVSVAFKEFFTHKHFAVLVYVCTCMYMYIYACCIPFWPHCLV